MTHTNFLQANKVLLTSMFKKRLLLETLVLPFLNDVKDTSEIKKTTSDVSLLESELNTTIQDYKVLQDKIVKLSEIVDYFFIKYKKTFNLN